GPSQVIFDDPQITGVDQRADHHDHIHMGYHFNRADSLPPRTDGAPPFPPAMDAPAAPLGAPFQLISGVAMDAPAAPPGAPFQLISGVASESEQTTDPTLPIALT